MEDTIEADKEFEKAERIIEESLHSLRQEKVGKHKDDFVATELTRYNNDLFNFEITVAIAKTEIDEMTTELYDALKEINAKKSFPCTSCKNVCK